MFLWQGSHFDLISFEHSSIRDATEILGAWQLAELPSGIFFEIPSSLAVDESLIFSVTHGPTLVGFVVTVEPRSGNADVPEWPGDAGAGGMFYLLGDTIDHGFRMVSDEAIVTVVPSDAEAAGSLLADSQADFVRELTSGWSPGGIATSLGAS